MRVIDTRPHRHGHPNSIRDNEHRKLKKLVHSREYLRAERAFYHACIMLRCGLGYSWDIHRVFMGYTYVSVMCRLCIGYVSVICRNRQGAKKEEKVHFFGEKFGNIRGFLYLCRRKWETGWVLRQLASIGLSILVNSRMFFLKQKYALCEGYKNK